MSMTEFIASRIKRLNEISKEQDKIRQDRNEVANTINSLKEKLLENQRKSADLQVDINTLEAKKDLASWKMFFVYFIGLLLMGSLLFTKMVVAVLFGFFLTGIGIAKMINIIKIFQRDLSELIEEKRIINEESAEINMEIERQKEDQKRLDYFLGDALEEQRLIENTLEVLNKFESEIEIDISSKRERTLS